MPRFAPLALVTLFALATTSPLASQPADDRLRAPIPEAERTEVLVLGSPHLARLEGFDPATVEPLLDALEAWGPEAIGIEELPPRVIATMDGDPAYGPVLERFAGERHRHGRRAQERLGLSWRAARTEADTLIRALTSGAADPRVRRDLVLRLLAGYEAESAALQYAILRDEAAATAETLPDSARVWLEELLDAPDESVRIGVTLARRLGLARVHPIDDHLDKDRFLSFAARLTEALRATEAYEAFVERGFVEARVEAVRRAHAGGDLLPVYRQFNAPEERDEDLEQWRLFFRTDLPSGLDRARVALWETRNLATAAHVRRMTAEIPGGRALVVIGASHVPFLEAYLSQTMDVEIVDAAEVLGAPPR